ncbi:hypothetical protein N473_20590 [Pseudoalteromonas luteoviolacea CPMOR-1]|uniref:Uncharacterized protein n=1 Tax=Pseudoalteromonas luteoviolacea CPMOR-1 TaxID=1365248 RepID=A0A161YKN3_9GAMM|nr:hypothetical protein [Pseudoalteromonas luteoviolacea]KZN61943.1 hypothetical protein N473_20590 [Pseudoalteromonas luteoviolacea CPMOR-1]
MKIDANAGVLLHANKSTADQIKNVISESKNVQHVDSTSSPLHSQPARPAEEMRAKSDNGKLETIMYTKSGRLDLPARYEQHRELIERVANSTSKLYLHDTPEAANRMAEQYKSISSTIYELAPELKNKSWGFSIDTAGQLVATGHLNQKQKRIIEDSLNSNTKLVEAAQDFKAHFIKGIEIERGSAGTSQYWGKYDVNNDNFADIFNFKEMLDYSLNSAEEVKFSGYALNKWDWTMNVSDQLKEKAELFS